MSLTIITIPSCNESLLEEAKDELEKKGHDIKITLLLREKEEIEYKVQVKNDSTLFLLGYFYGLGDMGAPLDRASLL